MEPSILRLLVWGLLLLSVILGTVVAVWDATHNPSDETLGGVLADFAAALSGAVAPVMTPLLVADLRFAFLLNGYYTKFTKGEDGESVVWAKAVKYGRFHPKHPIFDKHSIYMWGDTPLDALRQLEGELL